ncbi:hypothetical protein BZA05DRAFT_467826 [Tricharina praecox]|uniref:uncharacterized protein n=1 Tax=Tricharina praecox TaxID=43433 RepID=UPI00221F1848|nr:uncharacterized protein BZA05DRAFT_467826 [Tricharina praecox]KAI5854276.1 hypothetical protein BZA05DRAFT_467826 [Tricharina praecox]
MELDTCAPSTTSTGAHTPSLPPLAPLHPFTVTALPGKGLALLATSFIPTGTHLFSESPLLLLTSSSSHALPQSTRVLAGFSLLPPAPRAALLALCSNLPLIPVPTDESTALAVWKANNFCLDSEGTVNGVFALAARLNHACVGGENCRWVWVADGEGEGKGEDGGEGEGEAERGQIQFWTDRDIAVGEELTHCYRPDWRMGTVNRRAALSEEYGFDCGCTTCEEPEVDD